MKTHAALALLLCGFSAIAQTEKPKKPPPVPPPLPPMAYALEDAFGGLTFSQPLAMVSAPGETDRIFVVEKTGCIQAVTQIDQPTPAKHVFANLIERPDGRLDDKEECGLLGLAFHPGFAHNGRFYVYYSLRIGGQLHQRVSRFQVSPNDPQQADIASEQPLITQADPANNHNGGDYGWSHREGLHAFDLGPGKDQPPAGFHPLDPIFEYSRTTGISITGGRVSRQKVS